MDKQEKQVIINKINNLQKQIDETSDFDLVCLLLGQQLLLEHSLYEPEELK
jgi:hypothetical protein